MDRTTPWKLTTAVLAIACGWLALDRAQSSDDASSNARSDDHVATAEVTGASDEPQVAAAERRHVRRDDPGDAASAAEPPPQDALEPLSREEIVALLEDVACMRPSGSTAFEWQRVSKELVPRGEECIPVLDAWMDRLAELQSAGVRIDHLPYVYASVAKDRAVPWLVAFSTDPGGVFLPPGSSSALLGTSGLFEINTPNAAEAYDRVVRALPPGERLLGPDALVGKGGAMRDLARRWVEAPPPGHEALGDQARISLFCRVPADREGLWEACSLADKVRLGEYIRSPDIDLWKRRRADALREALLHADSAIRRLAVKQLASRARDYEDEILDLAARVAEAEATSGDETLSAKARDSLRGDAAGLRQAIADRRRDSAARRALDAALPGTPSATPGGGPGPGGDAPEDD